MLTTGAISAGENSAGMCCGQFQSKASTLTTTARCTTASYPPSARELTIAAACSTVISRVGQLVTIR